MPRIQPITQEKIPEFQQFFETVERTMGFVPRAFLTMGRQPDLLQAFVALFRTITAPRYLDLELKRLIAFVASRAGSSLYCQAHTAERSHSAGASDQKLRAAYEFEFDELFADRERAALELARAASEVPNATTDAHFDELRKYFDENEILEIVSVIALFGFLNRWNTTIGTELEGPSLTFAEKALATCGWNVGIHG